MQKIKNIIENLVSNPVYLFILFVFVNLVPTLELLYTEPINIVGKIILLIFPIALYCLFFSISRNIGLAFWMMFPLIFFHAFQMVVFALFGEGVLAADMFLNLFTTSVSEAGELLDSLLLSIFFVVILYIPALIFASMAIKRKTYIQTAFRYKISCIGTVLLLVCYPLSILAKNDNSNRFTFHEDVYPINIAYNMNFALDRWKLSNEYYETSKDFIFNAQRVDTVDQREIYVMVIGETGRSDSWSLYGYERETTPLLALDTNLILFSDAITQSNTTHKSVPIILSAASAEEYDLLYKQKSIIEAFNEVDFNTVFLSNQASNRTFTDYFAREADIHHYYRFFGDATNEFDEIVVDKMKYYIDSIPGNIFFVLHTYGSHFNYTERYPKEFAKYTPDAIPNISINNIAAMRNAYDNTILYTDYVLNKVINILEKTDACTAMYYSTDHGEDLLDDDRRRFLHASPSPTYYQLKIPFFLWFSPNYKTLFPDKVANAVKHKDSPVATNLAFDTMLDIASIDTDNAKKHLSLVNDAFRVQQRMYLDEHYNPIPYFNSGLRAQDKDMIKKRNMAY